LGGGGPEDGQGVQPRFFCVCDEVGGSVEDHGLGCVELEGVRRRGDEGGRREREGEGGRERKAEKKVARRMVKESLRDYSKSVTGQRGGSQIGP
jgi:hypothetical protein